MSTEEDSGIIDIKTGRYLSKAEAKFRLDAPEPPRFLDSIVGIAMCITSVNLPLVWSRMASILVIENPNNANAINALFSVIPIFSIMIFLIGLFQIYYNIHLWRIRRAYFRGNEK